MSLSEEKILHILTFETKGVTQFFIKNIFNNIISKFIDNHSNITDRNYTLTFQESETDEISQLKSTTITPITNVDRYPKILKYTHVYLSNQEIYNIFLLLDVNGTHILKDFKSSIDNTFRCNVPNFQIDFNTKFDNNGNAIQFYDGKQKIDMDSITKEMFDENRSEWTLIPGESMFNSIDTINDINLSNTILYEKKCEKLRNEFNENYQKQLDDEYNSAKKLVFPELYKTYNILDFTIDDADTQMSREQCMKYIEQEVKAKVMFLTTIKTPEYELHKDQIKAYNKLKKIKYNNLQTRIRDIKDKYRSTISDNTTMSKTDMLKYNKVKEMDMELVAAAEKKLNTFRNNLSKYLTLYGNGNSAEKKYINPSTLTYKDFEIIDDEIIFVHKYKDIVTVEWDNNFINAIPEDVLDADVDDIELNKAIIRTEINSKILSVTFNKSFLNFYEGETYHFYDNDEPDFDLLRKFLNFNLSEPSIRKLAIPKDLIIIYSEYQPSYNSAIIPFPEWLQQALADRISNDFNIRCSISKKNIKGSNVIEVRFESFDDYSIVYMMLNNTTITYPRTDEKYTLILQKPAKSSLPERTGASASASDIPQRSYHNTSSQRQYATGAASESSPSQRKYSSASASASSPSQRPYPSASASASSPSQRPYPSASASASSPSQRPYPSASASSSSQRPYPSASASASSPSQRPYPSASASASSRQKYPTSNQN